MFVDVASQACHLVATAGTTNLLPYYVVLIESI